MTAAVSMVQGQTMEEALVPRGAMVIRFSVVHDGIWVLYRTPSGLREQRRWTIASTTRWPD